MKERPILRAAKETEKVKILMSLWLNLAESCNWGMAFIQNIYLKGL